MNVLPFHSVHCAFNKEAIAILSYLSSRTETVQKKSLDLDIGFTPFDINRLSTISFMAT
jgi:hypothetical protein